MDFQKFFEGDMYDAYKYMGAHPEKDGVVFRTYAPSAEKVCIIGEFNNWTEEEMAMPERLQFYEIFEKNAKPGQMYKYVIYGRNGRVEHCDPYGFGMELRPGFASVVRDLGAYTFTDEKWMKERTRCYDRPLNIYELHLGSFRRNEKDPNGWYSYSEIADELIGYVKENGYTHVEFMPLSEHPFDGSWGYQSTGFFSPTSRYGSANELQELIDRLHNAGIGAILDFVPAHFALDYYALRRYDGTELYEYPASDVSDSEWGSCNFIFARREVACFMQSAANYWLTEYHFDGLRMDAISRVIYWMGNELRGVNETAVEFLKKMNAGIHRLHPSAMLIAEDSTSYPGCTRPVEEGGLGFDYKWDLGWMNDTLDYFMKTSDERKKRPELLTFSMYYFYNERHLLPLSHDEVVHGKRTIIGKIFGTYEEQFPQLRTLYLYMYMHPGKKLNFMGNEIAMFREWDETKEPDNFLLKYPMHDSFHQFMICLNGIYRDYRALSALDYHPEGFAWLLMNDQGHDVFAIRRNAGKAGEKEADAAGSSAKNGAQDREGDLAAIFNFSSKERTAVIRAENDERWDLILHTDWECWSGTRKQEKESVRMIEGSSAVFELPPFSAALYTIRREAVDM
ncbi:MAG: 1,4-alpha-glucan branching protein GlgB [Eubacteriales bacterium]|nr:1,4-alpha-glucan branching protein GlgB [Eubacteriales bacterium]